MPAFVCTLPTAAVAPSIAAPAGAAAAVVAVSGAAPGAVAAAVPTVAAAAGAGASAPGTTAAAARHHRSLPPAIRRSPIVIVRCPFSIRCRSSFIVHCRLPFIVHVSRPPLVLGLCPYSPAPFVCIRYIVSTQLIIILLTFKNKDH